ncbi:MAG: hypothetical protein LUF82_03650, partial [Clostridia bacterium]|nr:hypothetical protein [Clostridia bacterium]
GGSTDTGSTEDSSGSTNDNQESNIGSDTDVAVSAASGCGSISTGGGGDMFIISSAMLIAACIVILGRRKSVK